MWAGKEKREMRVERLEKESMPMKEAVEKRNGVGSGRKRQS